jgi:hypothetical protein
VPVDLASQIKVGTQQLPSGAPTQTITDIAIQNNLQAGEYQFSTIAPNKLKLISPSGNSRNN